MPELAVVGVVEAADNEPGPEARPASDVKVLANDYFNGRIREVTSDLVSGGASSGGTGR